MRTTEELLKDAEEAIETSELDYSICLDGVKVVNGEKLVAEMAAKLRESEELIQRYHNLCLEKIDDYETLEEYHLYKATTPKKET